MVTTVDGVEVVAGMKVYWESADPDTINGVVVTSVVEDGALFAVEGWTDPEIWVPLEWAYSTKEGALRAVGK